MRRDQLHGVKACFVSQPDHHRIRQTPGKPRPAFPFRCLSVMGTSCHQVFFRHRNRKLRRRPFCFLQYGPPSRSDGCKPAAATSPQGGTLRFSSERGRLVKISRRSVIRHEILPLSIESSEGDRLCTFSGCEKGGRTGVADIWHQAGSRRFVRGGRGVPVSSVRPFPRFSHCPMRSKKM